MEPAIPYFISMALLASIVRSFLRHLYHGLAWAYDLVAWLVSLGAWTDWVESALQFVEGQTVLELGPGTGHLQIALLESGRLPYGLDESSQMLRQAATRISGRGSTPALIRGLAQHIPCPNGTFDTIVSTFPTEYMLDPRSLSSIWRVLRPGGLLVVIPWGVRIETRWLFEATQQGPSMGARALPEALAGAGFAVQTQVQHRPRGAVGVILARKPARL
jgi:ubiquinone/menaquinone biosynthesis C-methylase UbiE